MSPNVSICFLSLARVRFVLLIPRVRFVLARLRLVVARLGVLLSRPRFVSTRLKTRLLKHVFRLSTAVRLRCVLLEHVLGLLKHDSDWS